VSSAAFGVAEGDPAWWVAVQVGSDVGSAKMTFADGSSDQMTPVDGVAVLAHHVPTQVASADPGPYTVRGTLELLGVDGTTVATVTLPQPAPTPIPLPAPSPAPTPGPGSVGGSSGGGTSSGGTASGGAAGGPVNGSTGAVPPSAAPATTSTLASSGGQSGSTGSAVACPQVAVPGSAQSPPTTEKR
jgi:hypothetical protein